MARSKGRRLVDQIKKLKAIGRKLGWSKHINWTDQLGVSAATVSNWFDGDPIAHNNIKNIASKINIESEELVSLPFEQFCTKAGISIEAALDPIFEPIDVFHKRQMGPHDIELMRRLEGQYCLLYLSREGASQDEYLSVEHVEIAQFDEGRCANPIRQILNFNTQTSPSGWIRITNERAVAILSYGEAYYPESLYYGTLIDESTTVLYGVYLDITARNKQIFAARFIMFPAAPALESAVRIENIDEIFGWCKEFLKDKSPAEDRERLYISLDRLVWESIRESVKRIRSMHPRPLKKRGA